MVAARLQVDPQCFSLDFNERRQFAEAIRQLVLSPDTLLEWAGVDVIRGLIKRTYGPEDWSAPECSAHCQD